MCDTLRISAHSSTLSSCRDDMLMAIAMRGLLPISSFLLQDMLPRRPPRAVSVSATPASAGTPTSQPSPSPSQQQDRDREGKYREGDGDEYEEEELTDGDEYEEEELTDEEVVREYLQRRDFSGANAPEHVNDIRPLRALKLSQLLSLPGITVATWARFPDIVPVKVSHF